MHLITCLTSLFLVVNCVDKVNRAIDDYLVATSGRSKSSYGNRNLDLEMLWNDFKDMYSKVYSLISEETTRYNHFKGHIDKIISHNRAYMNGERRFKLGINKYCDMHHDEFKQVMQGYRRSPAIGRMNHTLHQMIPGKTDLHVDWREKGAVTDVKDQGQCGSCYAFSATGALEGMEALKHKKLRNISEQQILDCSGAWGNMGCNGGLMDYSFQYVIDNEGIDNEVAYPYEAEDQNTCRFKRSNVTAVCDGFVDIESKNEEALVNACQHVGPISVAIDASSPEFMLYREGVYEDPNCSPDELNHGVLAVGYVVDDVPYWIVKNSWGKSWGDGGYIKMLAFNNTCGIATDASYPTVNQ